MYLAVDIGGTKTLLAAFDAHGNVKQQIKFPTPKDYDEFLKELGKTIDELDVEDFKAACVAVPGRLDRDHGKVYALGNLPWKNEPIEADIQEIIKAPVVIENDSKLAALSEAKLISKEFKKVLFVTVSTGISAGLIVDGVIDHSLEDSESGHMLLEHDGELEQWEKFASGRAIVAKYGKLAEEIDDPVAWVSIAHNIALGVIDLIAIIQPEVIVFGGGVGAHFDKFGAYLREELKSYEMPLVPIPPIRAAHRPEEAVIYGCYELVKERHGSPVKTT